jgi:hypothetical protein
MSEMDQEKQGTIVNVRRMYAANGNLTESEIEEFISYEFIARPTTLEDQIRRYFLMVKSNRPEKAVLLFEETEPILKKDVGTDQKIHDLSLVLDRYIKGFVLIAPLTQERLDEMAQDFPRPLKMITIESDEPYQVWRGTSQWAKWKAWRQGRPTVLGYGMTEEEAVEDLRYRVQPDHDGTLDGLGAPKGPVIGGNRFSADDVMQRNQRCFAQRS